MMREFIRYFLGLGLIVAHVHTTQAQTSGLNLPMLFSFSTTTTWKDFTLAPSTQHYSPKRWVWTGLITLKSTQPINLEELQLQWKGDKIKNLHAALYHKKETDKQLIPIQDNLICDGHWNPTTQHLVFVIDKKIIAVNKYYLVLNFSEADAEKIKHGSFVIPQKNSLKISYLE